MKNLLQRTLSVTVLMLGLYLSASSQDFLPFLNDNYAGINQVSLQPASIADSRFKVDINIVGFSTDFKNDLFKFNKFSINALPWEYTDPHWWRDYTTIESPDNKPNNAFITASVLAPSFLITLDSKQAIAFTFRGRYMLNADNLGDQLARQIYYDTEENEDWNQWSKWYDGTDKNIGNQMFAEYGITYARQVLDKEEHYLKAGGTIKLLQGVSAAYTGMEEYRYKFDPTGDGKAKLLSYESPYVNFGVTSNWGEYEGGDWKYNPKYTFSANPAIGFDLGVVYEWRPDYEKHHYDMDGKTNIPRQDLNKYKLRVGASVLDIGRIRYKNNPDQEINDFGVGAPGGTTPFTINLDVEELFNSPPFYDYADTISNRYGKGTSRKEHSDYFKMKLPTALSFQVDFQVVEHFYLNLTTFTAFNQKAVTTARSHYYSNYSVTPRYESKWFGAAMPLQYNQYGQFRVGAGLRLGILYIGTNDILGLLGLTNHFGSDFHFSLKIPIFQPPPPADMDNDAVSDAMDKCPTVPGVWEFRGCPDKDGDGVPDDQDLCPDDPGLKEYRGCPDRDGDGIIDKLDDCPSEPGLEEFNGCPDSDGDGIPDKIDQCPYVPGIAAFNGCPDSDGDGVPDAEDLCPNIPGLISMRGCPFTDTDGDGIKDEEDACPNDPGPIENKGCPYADTDGDGVLDKDDRCPLTPGDPTNFGCPILAKEEVEVLRTAFENLEFETAKAVIRASSFPSLNELASVMEKKPEYKLRIAGHTDSVGQDEYNMNLSKERAQSVAKYLQGKGIAPSRFVVEWFGETKPIADNNTAEGRQKNRRVEMEVIFD